MLHEIESLAMTPRQKERAQRVYDFYCGKIDQNSGSYKMGRLKDECKEFDIGSTTFYHDLKNLVDAGLLAKEGLQRPVLTMPVDEALYSPGGTMPEPSEDIAELADDEVALFIEQKSFIMREQRVMLDRDVAQVYGVETRRLNEQRERNPDNFPDDFAYQMSGDEISQNAMLDGIKFTHPPWSYTLEGINMSATVLKTPKAIQRSIVMVRTFSDIERMAHGEEPKQPGFAELMQMMVEQNKMLTNNITLQGKQLTDGIVEVKDDVEELETKVNDVGKKVDDLTNNELNNLIQADVDQYIHIDAYLISYQDGIQYGNAIAGLRRKIKGRYHLPLKCKTTEIPPRLLNTVSYDLHRSVLTRLDKHPDYFYKLNPAHQNFLITKGYTQL